MIPRNNLKKSFADLGYNQRHIVEDYQFAAVEESGSPVRSASMVAFFDWPPSYRNAALAVVQLTKGTSPEEQICRQRSLGAAYLIAIDDGCVSAWTMTSRGAIKIDEAPADKWTSFTAKHSSIWSADAVRRVKAINLRQPKPPQGLLFDTSVLHTIRVQVQQALDAMLKSFLAYFEAAPTKSNLSLQRDYALLFPLVFRLLTAKILHDRQDGRVQNVDINKVKNAVESVATLYSLDPLPMQWSESITAQLTTAWTHLLNGVYLRNIAADDLAFVYENTLITTQTRKDFGTHSTPPAVAEYVLRSFNLPTNEELQSIQVYEPFAGSCVFLTAAIRRFKELLPPNWSPETMHQHLIHNFQASEIDQFACEIARLSLILADYPNANGWHINNEDLFEEGLIEQRINGASMVICNPPFEDFGDELTDDQRKSISVHKPIAALNAILKQAPRFLGVVMPQGFAAYKKYRELHDKIVKQYSDVELLELPEGTFKHALVGAVVLIAQNPKLTNNPRAATTIRNSKVHRGTLTAFENTLVPSVSEIAIVNPIEAPGLTGLRPLREIWEYLRDYPRLADQAIIHRGMEWVVDQELASSQQYQPGWRKGLHRVSVSLSQFRIKNTTYLDARTEMARGGAINLPWDKPKVIANATRMSRGPWRLAACIDHSGLIVSQQFLGIWPINNTPQMLTMIAAILNSPLANAFSYVHDSERGLRIETMRQLPLPNQKLGYEILGLIAEYNAVANESQPLFSQSSSKPSDLLMEIDSKVLAAYDLPPKLEKSLLKFMNQSGRPCGHVFDSYPGITDIAALPLALRLDIKNKGDTFKSWKKTLAPFPQEFADIFDVA